MPRPRQKNIVERLAGAGEEAMQRIGSAPGADKVVGALGTLRDRVDELQKSVRAIDRLAKRLTAIEKRLDKLEGKGTARSRKTSSAKRSTAARKRTAGS
jgi:prefoldin subunit 5